MAHAEAAEAEKKESVAEEEKPRRLFGFLGAPRRRLWGTERRINDVISTDFENLTRNRQEFANLNASAIAKTSEFKFKNEHLQNMMEEDLRAVFDRNIGHFEMRKEGLDPESAKHRKVIAQYDKLIKSMEHINQNQEFEDAIRANVAVGRQEFGRSELVEAIKQFRRGSGGFTRWLPFSRWTRSTQGLIKGNEAEFGTKLLDVYKRDAFRRNVLNAVKEIGSLRESLNVLPHHEGASEERSERSAQAPQSEGREGEPEREERPQPQRRAQQRDEEEEEIEESGEAERESEGKRYRHGPINIHVEGANVVNTPEIQVGGSGKAQLNAEEQRVLDMWRRGKRGAGKPLRFGPDNTLRMGPDNMLRITANNVPRIYTQRTDLTPRQAAIFKEMTQNSKQRREEQLKRQMSEKIYGTNPEAASYYAPRKREDMLQVLNAAIAAGQWGRNPKRNAPKMVWSSKKGRRLF